MVVMYVARRSWNSQPLKRLAAPICCASGKEKGKESPFGRETRPLVVYSLAA
jgi:hypothetical protein